MPKDPAILLSYINTKLRDEYTSLDALVSDLDCDGDEITKVLGSIGYEYNEELNRFV